MMVEGWHRDIGPASVDSVEPSRNSTRSQGRSNISARLLAMAIWPWLYSRMASMAAGKFKNLCLKILDRVAQTRTPVTITKRGKPVATVVPYIATKRKPVQLAGSILEERDSPFGTNEEWDADPS